VLGPALILVPLFLGPSPPDTALAFLLAYAALAAEQFSGAPRGSRAWPAWATSP
jgi:hypothetical protein